MNDGNAFGCKGFFDQLIKRIGVELTDREIGWIGKVDDGAIEDLVVAAEPEKGILVIYFDAWIVKGVMIERLQQGLGAEEAGHGRIEIDECNLLNRRIF